VKVALVKNFEVGTTIEEQIKKPGDNKNRSWFLKRNSVVMKCAKLTRHMRQRGERMRKETKVCRNTETTTHP
jgi:hypothetical protein